MEHGMFEMHSVVIVHLATDPFDLLVHCIEMKSTHFFLVLVHPAAIKLQVARVVSDGFFRLDGVMEAIEQVRIHEIGHDDPA
jgi:hypothetical protein